MKTNNKFINNVINLALSNFIALFIGVLSSFITPYVLGHQEYGYYKIFILYSSYVPLFHIGFIDGMLVRNAGKAIKQINFQRFRLYTLFLFYLELILSGVTVIVALTMGSDIYIKEILISLAVYSLLFNMVTYFQFFSKCIMRFTQLAKVSRYQSYLTLFYLALAYMIYKFSSFKITMVYYIFFVNISLFIVLCWYIYSYRKIIFGSRHTLKREKKDILSFFRIGFSVMISYQITMFIINADNQFISMFFNVRKYAEYAFSYSMASLLITFFGAVSSVMLPYMKRKGRESVLQHHSYYISVMFMIIFVILLAYYPIVEIVRNFMPTYAGSLSYLKIVFPEVGITCVVQSYIFNNYILINKVKDFCIISIINLLIDFIVYYILYLLFNSMYIISLISVLMIFIWYVSLELYLKKITKIKIFASSTYIIILTIEFILFNQFVGNIWIGLFIYLVFYVIISILFFKNVIHSVFK